MMASTISNIPTKTSVERKSHGGYLFTIDIGTVNAWTFDLTDSEFEKFFGQVSQAYAAIPSRFVETSELLNRTAQTSTPQPPPTGNGQVVLWQAIARAVESLNLAESDWLCGLLYERAIAGKEKYKTWLRTDNGRSVAQDYLEEVLDAFMYATQERLETSSDSAWAKQEAALAAIQLCYEDERNKVGGKFDGSSK